MDTTGPRAGASPDVHATKAALRRTALAARRAVEPDDRRRASAAAVDRLLGLPELRGVQTVALYAALDEELDPVGALPRLVEAGVRTLFPRVRGERLELVAAADLPTLQLGYRGIREPVGIAIDPSVVDVLLVPGVAFDVRGGRLGQGGGHYDRLLATLPGTATAVGMCFACQVVPRVPMEDHDRSVDVVVTEAGVHRQE
jgi:5-formyltetrahydrofolate cyclo-ligase